MQAILRRSMVTLAVAANVVMGTVGTAEASTMIPASGPNPPPTNYNVYQGTSYGDIAGSKCRAEGAGQARFSWDDVYCWDTTPTTSDLWVDVLA